MKNSLTMATAGGYARFGDPNDTYKLPADVSITLGDWGISRGTVEMARSSGGDSRTDAQIVA